MSDCAVMKKCSFVVRRDEMRSDEMRREVVGKYARVTDFDRMRWKKAKLSQNDALQELTS